MAKIKSRTTGLDGVVYTVYENGRVSLQYPSAAKATKSLPGATVEVANNIAANRSEDAIMRTERF